MLRKLVLAAVALCQCAHAALIQLNPSNVNTVKSFKPDYIIVGGGTAGLVVGKRLSDAFSKKKILVLEAGRTGVGDDLVTIPKNSFSFIFTERDWNFTSVPQEHANNLEINVSQGRLLGGDSAINGLVWVRGAKEEYDAIERLGSKGWNWNTLYNYMKKSENLIPPSDSFADEYGLGVQPRSHGQGGPVDVTFPKYIPLQHQTLVQAAQELGHSYNTDPYRGNPIGVTHSLSSQTSSAVRETSEFAYLTPELNDKNYLVASSATVSKVNTATGAHGYTTATGVQVRLTDGTEVTVNLAKDGEVILSAGVFKTPQLLELSGIGDRNVLRPLGIQVKEDLPGVGRNFEDHPLTILTYQLKEPFLSFDALEYNQTLVAEQTALYQSGKGWFTFAQAVVDFEPISVVLTPEEIEEAKVLLQNKPESISLEEFEIIKEQVLKGTPQVEYLLFNSFSGGDVIEPNRSYISLAVTQTHPLSRGTVHIGSTNIRDSPKIDINILESEWDKWFLAKITAYGRKIFETEAFQAIVEPEEVFPGPSVQTHEQWTDFIARTVNAGYHGVGTASLLPQSAGGVVDSSLLVYGTSNLRVADMSVIPVLISAHTQTLAYAVGEKAADVIIDACRKKKRN